VANQAIEIQTSLSSRFIRKAPGDNLIVAWPGCLSCTIHPLICINGAGRRDDAQRGDTTSCRSARLDLLTVVVDVGWAVRRAQSDVGCTNALRTHEVPLIYINLPREERRNLASGA
jgi:hypothetical protein